MKRKQLPEEEIIEKYNNKQSIISLSKEYSCGQGKIKRILDKNSVHIRGMCESQLKVSTYIPDSNYKQVEDLYNSGMSTHKLAKHYNCNRKYLVSYMKRNNIVRRNDYADPVRHILEKNKQIIINMYNKHKSVKPIAQKFNCSEFAIQQFMDINGITRKHKLYKVNIPIEDIDLLYKLHHENEYTMQQLADLYNCTSITMADFFDNNNIKRRTQQQAVSVGSYVEKRMKTYMKSIFAHKPYTLPSGRIIKVQGYEPQFLDYVFKNKIYKEEDFDFGVFKIRYSYKGAEHYYFPDFYIPKDNLVIEIKSSYILKRQGIGKNRAKVKGTVDSGYKHILILDNNFQDFDKVVGKILNN